MSTPSTDESRALRAAKNDLERIESALTQEYPHEWSEAHVQDVKILTVLRVFEQRRKANVNLARDAKVAEVAAQLESGTGGNGGGMHVTLPRAFGSDSVAFVDGRGHWMLRRGGEDDVSVVSDMTWSAPATEVAGWLQAQVTAA